MDNLQAVHLSTQTASNSAMLTASTFKHYPIHLTKPFYVATELNDYLETELETDSIFESLCMYYELLNDAEDYDEVELGTYVNDEMSPLLSSIH